MRNALIVAAAVIVAAGLFIVLRPDNGNDNASGNTTTTGTATSASATTSTTSPAPPPPANVRIVVRGGEPVGGIRNVTVAKGRRVVLIVNSDVADEVHLHGYNLKRDVEPGTPARLPFRATINGTVEVELEQRGVPLARITTQP
jgi:heme/copper-type cytochrome/quinol oxidase subunit 2